MSLGLKNLSHWPKGLSRKFIAQVNLMPKNLSEALSEAKERRGVFSKTIIWESGVSKSQFYRIIKGQEAPSAETKQRMSEALELDVEQFDSLFKASNLDRETPRTILNRTGILALMALGAIVLITGFMVSAAKIEYPKSQSVVETNVVNPDDKTLFIKDVTIPDGTSIPVNTTFVKTWRVKNVGSVVWKNRYLKRMTPHSELICSSPSMVPIPETQPGETIDISVTFKTPHLPGSCRTDWKTSDDRGNLYFPDMHGLFSIVAVVED